MSYFEPQTKAIDLDDENSVTVRQLAFGQRQDIMTRVMGNADEGNMLQVQFAMQSELLQAAIASWDGPGFDGRSVTPENIAELPSHIADRILDEADDFLKGVSETEKKASGGPQNSP